MQVDIALQYDRTCEPYALWNDEFAAAFQSQCIDSLGKGCGTERRAISNSTKVLEVYLIGWELWTGHLLHLEWQILVKSIILLDVGCLGT